MRHNKIPRLRFAPRLAKAAAKRALGMTGKQCGHTLAEVLVAGVLVGMIFVTATSLYVSGLKFLNYEIASSDIDSLLAFETVIRNINNANEVLVDQAGAQLKLRVDTNEPSTASTADDQWVTYRFISSVLDTRLRRKVVLPPNAIPADVTVSDSEVVPNLKVLLGGGQSGFQLINPSVQGAATVVKVQLVVAAQDANSQPRTFLTSASVKRAK